MVAPENFRSSWRSSKLSTSQNLRNSKLRSTVERLRKVELSHYKQWRASKRNGTPSYKALESSETIEGKQAGTPETAAAGSPACLPAEHERANEPETGARLAALRSVFPNEYLASASLDAVDRHLAAALCDDYDPEGFVARLTVGCRRSGGCWFSARPGVVADRRNKSAAHSLFIVAPLLGVVYLPAPSQRVGRGDPTWTRSPIR